MYACHLLLGTPWFYDNQVIYDGYANTYSLKPNGKSLTWAPYLLPNLTMLSQVRKVRKAPTRVKCRKNVPLVRVSLELPY